MSQNSPWPLVRPPAGGDDLYEEVDDAVDDLDGGDYHGVGGGDDDIFMITRRDPSILPYGPTAKMLRDSDPEKACSIKCYSTDSKEVLLSMVKIMMVMTIIWMMLRIMGL